MRLKIAFGLAAVLTCGATASWAGDTGKPMYGAWGLDIAGMDKSVKPGDDFFEYANGTWLAHATIPADKSGATLRLEMSDRTEKRIHDILAAAAAKADHQPATVEGKAGAFFKSFMDEARIEKLGAGAIKPELDAIRAARTHAGIAALMGKSDQDFYGSLFSLYVTADAKDPKHYALYATQAGLGLPDRDYYLKNEFAAQKAAYQAYVAKMLSLAGWPDADAQARNIVAFETRIAASSWTKAQQRDAVATYNPMTIDALVKYASGFAWHNYLAAVGTPGLKRMIVSEKTAFPKIAKVFAQTQVTTLQAYLAFTVADNAAPYLSKPFSDAIFEMRDKTLSGQRQQQARWKRAVRAVSGGDFLAGDRRDRFGNMGWGVGQIYTTKYFPPAAKKAIEDLVANLKAAYHARIEHLDWMSAKTKAQALKKLETYTIKVGYPDRPRDYSSLVILDDDLVGNVKRAAAADWAYYVAELPKPVDRGEWYMTPQTNDAYNGPLRDIVFPAGILQPPIFDVNADPAINYGAAGGVIGHELTHGFDDEGRKFAADGSLRDWWQPQDAKIFDVRAAKLGAQYSAFTPFPGVHVNGKLTMGENIADLGGVTLALAAYRASLHGKPAPVIDGFTGDQRVFLGWAQAWRGKLRDDAVKKQVVSDPHSPRPYRVNGPMRNVDAWYSAFDVQPGEKLYLAPKDRVHIW